LYAARNDVRRVCVVGAFPPPVHGMAIMNELAAGVLAQAGVDVLTFNLAPPSFGVGPISIVARMMRFIRALLLFLVSAPGSKAIYIGLSGGYGQYFESVFLLVARGFRLNVILHHHSFAYLSRKKNTFSVLNSIAGNRAVHIVLCNHMAGRLRDTYPHIGDVHVISNHSFVDYSASNCPVRTELSQIGFFSNVSQSKGVFKFLRVAEQLRAEFPSLKFVIGGPFIEPNLEAEVLKKVRSVDNVEWIGPVYGKKKQDFFHDTDLLLFPSTYVNEAEPLTIHEALSWGIPVVAIERGCISEIIDREVGLVVQKPQEYVREASEYIRALMAAPKRYESAHQAAIQLHRTRLVSRDASRGVLASLV
jgi:glycosyltransferase involved in cell wall biosynthesis